MTETVRFQCLNCGHKFEAEALTADEKRQARDEGRPLYPMACPKCQRTDTRRGWS